jgi:hypothetical protein
LTFADFNILIKKIHGGFVQDIDSTLTDYALTAFSLWAVFSLRRLSASDKAKHALWSVFFSAVAVASFLGGTVHGFIIDDSTIVHHILWRLTLAAVGLAAFCAWGISGIFISGRVNLKYWLGVAGVAYLIYLGVIVFVSQNYAVVILNYAPAMLFLLFVSAFQFFKKRVLSCKYIFWGMVLTFAAAAVQQLRMALSTEYFDHNATYHLVQGIGLFLIYKGAREEIHSVRVI